MQWTNEWIEQGRDQGRAEGRRELVLRQLRRRFGVIPAELTQRIEELALFQIDELGEALLDFPGLEETQRWLDSH